MKKQMLRTVIISMAMLFALYFPSQVLAEIEWSSIDDIELDDKPIGITASKDGSTYYILCNKSILIYSAADKKVTDTIPITRNYSEIAVSPDGEKLFLTDTQKKQLSILEVIPIYDIKTGLSPVIGEADAPVSLFVFMDYQ